MVNMDFDLNALKIFVSVYENKGIESASKKLFVTQPAVSIAIKKLEKKLGGQLFTRLPKGIKPTAEGEKFYSYCKNALNQISQGIENFSEENAMQFGSLNIGASTSIIKHILMPVISNFCKEYPNIKIIFTEVIASRLQRYMFKGEIDIAFMEEPINDIKLYQTFPITSLKHILIAKEDFKNDYLSKDELQNQKFAVLKTNTNSRIAFDDFCFETSFNLPIFYEMASNETLLEIVKQGYSIGFSIKEFCKNELENNILKEIKLQQTLPQTNVLALLPKGDTNGFVTQKFLQLLKNYYKN